MSAMNVRLGSTYRITVPFYAFTDGTTLTDLDALPTLQVYASNGTTAVGSAVTCTKLSTGIYYGDMEFNTTDFAVGIYIWKMYGLSGGNDVNQTGEVHTNHVI